MAYPTDVSLPASAKFFGIIDQKNAYNVNWDVVWSFTYALTGTQHGFCSFLTTTPTMTGGVPGHYMGYLGNTPLSAGIVSIAFDSTGFYALSNTVAGGVPLSSTRPNSLVIRDYKNTVVFNSPLSSLDTSFVLASSSKVYQTLRFRYCNSGRLLYVDYKKPSESYINLASVALTLSTITDNMVVYPGVTFCSPLSSTTITPSTFYLQLFHSQGNTTAPSYEIMDFTALSTSSPTYTTVTTLISS